LPRPRAGSKAKGFSHSGPTGESGIGILGIGGWGIRISIGVRIAEVCAGTGGRRVVGGWGGWGGVSFIVAIIVTISAATPTATPAALRSKGYHFAFHGLRGNPTKHVQEGALFGGDNWFGRGLSAYNGGSREDAGHRIICGSMLQHLDG
jgi:hypothetical protein